MALTFKVRKEQLFEWAYLTYLNKMAPHFSSTVSRYLILTPRASWHQLQPASGISYHFDNNLKLLKSYFQHVNTGLFEDINKLTSALENVGFMYSYYQEIYPGIRRFFIFLLSILICRDGSRAAATSKMERFVIIVNDLTIITKCSILDVAATLDPPLKC